MVRDRGNGAPSDSSEEEEEEEVVGGEEIDSDSDQVPVGKLCLKISVMDPHHRDADPWSNYRPYADLIFIGGGFGLCLFDADPDPTFHLMWILIQLATLMRIRIFSFV